MTENIELDEVRQQKAKEYARIRRKLFIVDIVLGAIIVLIWLVTGLSIWWRDQIMTITTNPWLIIALFVLGFGLVFGVISAPLSYYSGFVLPHRYGISRQSFKAWLWDQFKGLAVSGVIGLIILEIIYWLLRAAPTTWWLWMTLFMLAFSVLLNNLAPVLLFPIFYKFIPLENQELKDPLIKLAQRAG